MILEILSKMYNLRCIISDQCWKCENTFLTMYGRLVEKKKKIQAHMMIQRILICFNLIPLQFLLLIGLSKRASIL